MQIAKKTVTVLTLAVALGISSNALASETDDSSLDALKQEVAELKQVVAELAKYIKNLETRLGSIERAVSQRENPNKLMFPLDVIRGTWIDDLQMQQKQIQRRIDEGAIRPVKPPR